IALAIASRRQRRRPAEPCWKWMPSAVIIKVSTAAWRARSASGSGHAAAASRSASRAARAAPEAAHPSREAHSPLVGPVSMRDARANRATLRAIAVGLARLAAREAGRGVRIDVPGPARCFDCRTGAEHGDVVARPADQLDPDRDTARSARDRNAQYR